MKEALYPIVGSNVVFKETFNSLNDIDRNGGTPTDVSVSNGVGTFNGTTSYIDTNNTFEGKFRSSFSIELKVRPSDGQPSSDGHIISYFISTARCLVKLNTDGTISFSYESNNVGATATSSGTLTNGAQDWVSIIAVADSTIAGAGGLKIYINGAEDGTANTATVDFSLFQIIYNLYIGTQNNAGTPGGFYSGDIDYINIYNKALTASEVSNLYNKTQYKGLVKSGLVFNMDARTGLFSDRISGVVPTNTNTELKRTEKGLAGYFDGGTLAFSNNSNINFERTDSFTIEAWIKTDDTDGLIVAKLTGASSYRGYRFMFQSNKIDFYLVNDQGAANYLRRRSVATGIGNDGLWHQLILTYDGSSDGSGVNMYVDNVLIPAANSINSLSGTIQNTEDLMLATHTRDPYPLKNHTTLVRMYNNVLTAQEIAQNYQEFLSSF